MPARISGVHLDAVGGIAGDMFVAAMLDALPDLRERVTADAAAALPDGYAPALLEGESGQIRALRFGLDASGAPESPLDACCGHDHGGGHAHHHDHAGRDAPDGLFPALVRRIRAATLQVGTADHAVAILTLLAEAEAAIHGVAVDHVRFHEIADWDSLLDVVAAGSIAAALDGTRWTVSSLPRGGGMVRTRHGLLPVPAPATAALLTDFIWRDDGVTGERVTPTGAAILRHLVGPNGGSGLGGRLAASGTGAGTRNLPNIPNILRALVFTAAETVEKPGRDTISILSFEVDDMTGEEIGTAADRLRAVDGVLDVSLGQRIGKKGRPMQSFRILVRPDAAEKVIERCFLETSTIGLRVHDVARAVLPRRLSMVEADGIAVGVKTVQRAGASTVKIESDDLAGETLADRRRLKRRAEESLPE